MTRNNRYGGVSDASSSDSEHSSDEENDLLVEKDDVGSIPDRNWKLRATMIAKFLSYPVVFLTVLIGNVIAKGTVLLMTSQLRRNRTVLHCNRLLDEDKTLAATVPEEERMAWIWCIIIAFAAPEVFTLLQSVLACLFTSSELPRLQHFLVIAAMQTLHVIGLAIMFVAVLPELDVIRGAMLTSCVCFVPGLLGLLSRSEKRDGSKRFVFAILDIVALAAQGTAFVLWPLKDNNSSPSLWLIPVSLILVSCGWWENYISIHSPLGFMRSLARMKEETRSAKDFTYVIVSVWKIVTFILATVLILKFQGDTWFTLFTRFGSAFGNHAIVVNEIQPMIGGGVPNLTDVLSSGMKAIVIADFTAPVYTLLVQISGAYFAYVSGKFACKTLIQGFSYAAPINLTVSVLTTILIAICNLRDKDPCFFHGVVPDYLFFEAPELQVLSNFIFTENSWIGMLWSTSQTWITVHIYTSKCERPEPTEKLFAAPYYSGLLIDQSMGLNRRRDEGCAEASKSNRKRGAEDGGEEPSTLTTPGSAVTKIYACATMWHENKAEMAECLRSIVRLDKNQCAMRSSQEMLKIVHPDFYELESHIFIDNAFVRSEHDKKDVQVNEWVKQFVKLVDETTFRETRILVKPLKKYPTPYGGRLVWTLPGSTRLFVHLKDSSKIRQKKRWSQVMYMYYLLHHRIKAMAMSRERRRTLAENSFILALDGDTVFQPSAVKLLVDLMKNDANLGAACGRIHPLGSGPMVWYQMFEYAIGHWLQKATEHMIGCVLCSPGCFSLFRAKALMQPSVLKTYTTKSTQARHLVQYDQGEDRWLCTLLLKRGYRVEYSAASDAYTHAPEGFNEFYKQRRRWLSSTMANLMDLLGDWKTLVERNDHISRLYMLYQLLLMAGTILGPGNIFLMMVGAFVAAFHIDVWQSFYWNLIPVLIFVVVCFVCNPKTQLLIAAVVSMLYGIVMIAVVVGIFMQIFEDTWLAPSSIFLILVIGQIVVTGLLHPQELGCLPHGLIYYLTIPSMYMLLMIYSIANMNDISWGTRVGKGEANPQESDGKKKDLEEAQEKSKARNQQRSFFASDKKDHGSMEFSFPGLFKCILCTHRTSNKDEDRLDAVAKSLGRLEQRFDQMESYDHRQLTSGSKCPVEILAKKNRPLDPEGITPQGAEDVARGLDSDSESSTSQDNEVHQERAFLVNPYWLEDDDLKRGEVDFLTAQEELFWEDIIAKHLPPVRETVEEEEKVAADLKDLRDKSFVTFFMLNALFVTTVFLMQLNQYILHIEWPLSSRTDISYAGNTLEVHIGKNFLQLEPIGLVFVAFFGVILVVQFTAMLFHRFGTFTHILADASLQELGYCWRKPKNLSQKAFLVEVSGEIVEELERSANGEIGQRRNAIDPGDQSLDDVFRRRIFSMSEGSGLPRHVSTRRSTMIFEALKENQSISAQRRSSRLEANGNRDLGERNGHGLGQTETSLNNLNPIREDSERHSGVANLAFEIDETLT